MANDTLEQARQRVIKERNAQFIETISPGQNLYALIRLPDACRKPFIPTPVTVRGETEGGNVSVYLYAAGKQTRPVSRLALYYADTDWCRDEPLYSVMHCADHLEGKVYKNRRVYVRCYPQRPDRREKEEEELTEDEVKQDWLQHPETFQLSRA